MNFVFIFSSFSWLYCMSSFFLNLFIFDMFCKAPCDFPHFLVTSVFLFFLLSALFECFVRLCRWSLHFVNSKIWFQVEKILSDSGHEAWARWYPRFFVYASLSLSLFVPSLLDMTMIFVYCWVFETSIFILDYSLHLFWCYVGYLNSCSALKNHFFERTSSHSLKNPRFSLSSNYEGNISDWQR